MIRSALALAGLALLILPMSILCPARSTAAEAQSNVRGAPTPEQQKATDEFVKIWAGRRDGVFANRFLGVKTLQNPLDAWITQEILSEVKPDLVVEAGTYHGGSALMWAMLLEEIEPNARVVTIDIKDHREKRAKEHPLAKRRVNFLLGSSTDPKIVADVTQRAKGKRVVVILDSLHTTEHVLAELRAYWPLVGVGSYIIVQDTAVGPGQAVADFLAENDRFVIDKGRERLWVTNNRNGFLERVK